MSGHGGNTALRTLLDEAEMSNTALGRAVVAGAKEKIHLGTNTTSVKRMLDGCQPRWPAPRLVAAVLSRRLRREVSITECGFADRTPAEEDHCDGLSCAGTLESTVRTVVELSGRDMRRRNFLLGSVFSAGAFSEPALVALTVPPVQGTASAAGGRRIGMAEVEVLTEQVTHLRTLDCRYGSGRVREQMVQLLHHEANELLHGTYSEKTGKALLTAVAQACWLAGFMAWDVDRHSLAQRYYIQGLDLAMRAGDRPYAGYLLSQMGRMTSNIARSARTEHDRLRNARQTVALARTGLSVTPVTVYRWVQRFTPLLIDVARPCRHTPGDRWFVDETYVKVAGQWIYLYRALDQFGQVIDVLAAEKWDMAATRRFVTRALEHGPSPTEVITDKAAVSPPVFEELAPGAWHHTEPYANNRIESDHDRLTSRLRPMRGLQQLRCAQVISAGHAFVRNLRRGHYELGTEETVNLRVLAAFDELALAI